MNGRRTGFMNRGIDGPALIAGCGIAGPAAALLLARIGIPCRVFEARSRPAADEGAFLNLTPNGMAVLRTLGVHEAVLAAGHPSRRIDFHGNGGKPLGSVEISRSGRDAVDPVVIRRSSLNQALREAAIRRGAQVLHGKEIVEVRQPVDSGVEVRCSDGTAHRGAFLLGCDGIHSAVRTQIFPRGPEPEYTETVDSAGFLPDPGVPETGSAMRMYFGRRAFFGYTLTPAGEVFWFSNHHRAPAPGRGELERIGTEEWRRMLLELHRGDPSHINRIIGNTPSIGRWPIHDLGALDRWHDGRVCLLGDAAHATSPHVGGGASLALEDAVVVARCIRDLGTGPKAFGRFQGLRQDRVRKMVAYARKVGHRKTPSTRFGVWLRDLVLPFFLERAGRDNEWIHSYRVSWDERVLDDGGAA